MRSREMLNKLDRLSGPAEHTYPDISLLSPEEQDRVSELCVKARLLEEGRPDCAITEAEIRELEALRVKLPVLGPHDNFTGPNLDIPPDLSNHFQRVIWHEGGRQSWPHLHFHGLKQVEKVRFVELCRQYGWEGEYPRARPLRRFEPSWKRTNLLPLREWDPEDEAKIRSLLVKALVRE